MSFIKTMQQRYTTKEYNSSKKIDLDKIEELKEILRLTPSSINSQPWKFIFISDSKLKEELAKASFFNDEKVKNCGTIVVFTRVDDVGFFENQINEILPERAVIYYEQFIKPKPSNEIKSWFDKQVYLALGVFLSACAEMKIDATPMEGIEHDKYNKLLNLKNYHTLVAVAIGYRDQNDFNQPSKKTKSRKTLKEVVKSI